MQPQPQQTPSAKSGWQSIPAHQETKLMLVYNTQPRMSQDDAFDVIKQSSQPVIVITKDSAGTYGGMMRYISRSFPNAPIMVEDGGNINSGPICDVYEAKSSFKGNMMNRYNYARFQNADTVIVFGKNPEAITSLSNTHQTILSKATVTDGVNIALASFSDDMPTIGRSWAQWNNRCITPRRIGI